MSVEPVDRDQGVIESAARAAAGRVSFQLTYGRAEKPRRFQPGFLDGPDIPCAYGGEVDASGAWEDGGDMGEVFAERTEEEWVTRYASYAINEGVHEVLEWLRVDGRPWLDPHGPDEDEVYAAVGELVARLAEVRGRREGVRAAG